MAVAFRDSGTSTFSVTATPVVTKPAGTVNGDLIVVCFVTDNAHDRTVPSGWSAVGTEVDLASTDTTMSAIYRVASGEGASWTFTNYFAASESGIAGVLVYSGAHQTTPINQAASADLGTLSASGTASGPSVTPSVNDCMIVQFLGIDPGAAQSATADASPVATERLDNNNALLGWVYAQEYLQGTAAAIALDAVITNSDSFAAIQFAIAPPSGGSDTATMGVAVASGVAPVVRAAGSVGVAAAAAGVAPTASVGVSQGVAAAAGVTPTSSASAALTPGVATASGVAPTSSTAVTPSQGVATATGVSPNATVTLTPTLGVATTLGVSPAATATAGVGTASAGGVTPLSAAYAGVGSATGQGVNVGAAASLTRGTAAGVGITPSEATITVIAGAVTAYASAGSRVRAADPGSVIAATGGSA